MIGDIFEEEIITDDDVDYSNTMRDSLKEILQKYNITDQPKQEVHDRN